MTRLAIGAMALALLLLQSPDAWAETCDAGHGCKIKCTDGCGAIYWPETNECSTFCAEDDEATTVSLGKMSTPAPMGTPSAVSGSFENIPSADIVKILTGKGK